MTNIRRRRANDNLAVDGNGMTRKMKHENWIMETSRGMDRGSKRWQGRWCCHRNLA